MENESLYISLTKQDYKKWEKTREFVMKSIKIFTKQ